MHNAALIQRRGRVRRTWQPAGDVSVSQGRKIFLVTTR